MTRSFTLTALMCLAATAANASEPGFYAIASIGQGHEDPKSRGTNFVNSQGVIHLDPDRVTIDDGDRAWSIGLGYRINRYLAGEVEYVDFGTTDINEHYDFGAAGPVPFPGFADFDFSSHVTGPALSVLGTLPVGDRFEIFVRAGALFASRDFGLDSSFSAQHEKLADTTWLAGAGVSWSFAKRWGIRAEYQQTGELEESLISGETSLDRVSVSALFRF